MAKPALKFLEDLRLDETLAPLMSSEKSRYVSFVTLALALVLSAATLLGMFHNWYADYKISHQALAAGNLVNLADAQTQQIDNIPAQHIFGSQATEDADFLPITSSQIHLTGIINDADAGTSRVIISEAGQPGKIYSIGDEVLSGIKINAINDDSVVLEHGGRFEKLPLVRASLAFKDSPKSLWKM
jgi:type II secretory pathway component PulC